jgi:hypothetical protein
VRATRRHARAIAAVVIAISTASVVAIVPDGRKG